MNVLAIDTSTAMLGLGLQTAEHYFELNQDVGLHHTENLLKEVHILLDKSTITASQLDLVVVAQGPGSFTGLRIGLSTAKGLSFGAGIPLVAVPTLDMYAYGHRIFPDWVVPVIDARKQRVYAAFYKDGAIHGDILDITPELLLRKCNTHDHFLLTGPYAGLLCGLNRQADPQLTNCTLDPLYAAPKTFALLQQGVERFQRQGGDNKYLGPLYIRPSEAELSNGR